MKQIIRKSKQILLLTILALALVSCAGKGDEPGEFVQNVSQTFEEGMNSGDLAAFDAAFATPEQGGDAAGQAYLRDPAHQLLDSAQPSDLFEIRSLDILDVQTDDSTGTATVQYRVDFSQVRDGEVIYAAVIEGHVALVKSGSSWLIAGGDQPSVDVQLAPPAP